MKISLFVAAFISLFLSACSGCGRWFSNGVASNFGADWVIVQYAAQGNPINCWKLRDVSVDNESGSDGIQWIIPGVGMMHLAGWYARIMVDDGSYAATFKYLGLNVDSCPGGRYLDKDVQLGEITINPK